MLKMYRLSGKPPYSQATRRVSQNLVLINRLRRQLDALKGKTVAEYISGRSGRYPVTLKNYTIFEDQTNNRLIIGFQFIDALYPPKLDRKTGQGLQKLARLDAKAALLEQLKGIEGAKQLTDIGAEFPAKQGSYISQSRVHKTEDGTVRFFPDQQIFNAIFALKLA